MAFEKPFTRTEAKQALAAISAAVPTNGYDWEKLRAPFPAADIEWRIGSSGITKHGKVWAKVLAYVTARAAEYRLDEVFGPENWQSRFVPVSCGKEEGFICELSVRVGDSWVTKSDGAPGTPSRAKGQAIELKGGISGALKRAASTWGIGRYLYYLEEGWAATSTNKQDGWAMATVENVRFWWKPPELPDWAKPGGSGSPVSRTEEPRIVHEPAPDVPEPEPESKLHPAPGYTEADMAEAEAKAAELEQKFREAKHITHLNNIVGKHQAEIARIEEVAPPLADKLRGVYAERRSAL